MIHKYFKNILYIDSNHTYVNVNTGELLTSVTTKIKQFEPKFPKDAASKYAKKHKLTLAEVKQDWYNKRVLGTNKGSALHKYLEDRIHNKYYEYTIPEEIIKTNQERHYEEALSKMLIQADEFLNDYNYLIPIANELVINNDKVAGQIDYLAYDPNIDLYRIIDFKQDKKIEFSNKYLKFFNDPLGHLDHCNFNKYQLQISMYRYIMEQETDLKFGDSLIVRFHETLDTYEVYTPKYLINEVKSII